jgi:predicted  nucleic acid-binding Zn-ribbon protein
MNADPAVQAKLLDLAAVDTDLARLAHRRRTLPEQQEVQRLEGEQGGRRDASAVAEMRLEDLDRDIAKYESEIDAVRKREDRDRAMLREGAVAAKQLSDLEHELATLQRRQTALEDDLLTVMEQRETAETEHRQAAQALSDAVEELAAAAARRDAAVAELDATQQQCNTRRAELVDALPDELTTVYQRQLDRSSAGAALLQARRCGGCRIELDRGEIARIVKTPPETVVRCPECGAILVRTKESGL